MSAAPHTSPSGVQIELRHGDQRAVVTSCGASLRAFSVAGRDVVDGYGEDEVCAHGRGQVLMPWPNRVREGTYSAGGVAHQLDISEPARGNAIHGLVRWVTWSIASREAAAVSLTYDLWASQQYPFALRLGVEYLLAEDGLTVRMSARNVGSTAAPYGAGAHPYIRAAEAGIDDCSLQLPAATVTLCDAQLIPTGTAPIAATGMDFLALRELGRATFDTCFTDLQRDADGRAHTRLSGEWGEVELWQDPRMEFLMVYSGDGLSGGAHRRSLAVEPMTCAPNAFQSGDGLVQLQPGGTHVCTWGIRAALKR